MQRHGTENSHQIFPEMKLRGLVPISTFMFLWGIYIFPRSVLLFSAAKEECGNWERGRAVSFLGIQKSDLLCSAVDNKNIFFWTPSINVKLICRTGLLSQSQRTTFLVFLLIRASRQILSPWLGDIVDSGVVLPVRQATYSWRAGTSTCCIQIKD